MIKKAAALLAVVLSGGYLVTLGITPDPLPFLDEGVALIVLVKSLQVLGVDLTRFLPFLGKRFKKQDRSSGAGDQTIDV